MVEIWKDVIGYEGLYLISTFGNIKSLDKTVKSGTLNNPTRFIKGKQLKLRPDQDGYFRVSLTLNFKKKIHFVHRLVLSTFVENKFNKPQINHKNGIKSDNNLLNLEWCTLSENRSHAYATGLQNGLSRRGEKSNFAKLTKDQVITIRAEYVPYKVTQKQLGIKYGITQSGIQHIIKLKSWNYL